MAGRFFPPHPWKREAAGWAPLAQSRGAMNITVLGNAEGEAAPWADSALKLRWRNLTPFSLQRQRWNKPALFGFKNNN